MAIFFTMQRRTFLNQIGLISSLSFTNSVFSEVNNADEETDILILGAGISGLYLADYFQEKGLSVTVYEASNRIGGRLFTLDDLPGKPNCGGTEIGDGYVRLVALAKKMNINLVIPKAEARTPGLLSINGSLIKETEWAVSSQNKLTENEHKILPSLLEFYLVKNKNPLKTLEDWYAEKFQNYDVSYAEYLKTIGLSTEAIRLINANANTNDIHTTSALNIFRAMTFREKGGSKQILRIEGGSQRLPEAIVSQLKTKPLLNKIVDKIETNASFVKVRCKDKSTIKAKFCISTIPFPAFKNIQIKNLNQIQTEAINQLPYTQITQFHLGIKSKFWEEDQLPISMWTDAKIGRFFGDKGSNGVENFMCWTNGLEAIELDKLSEKNANETIIKNFEDLRPASKGKIEVLKTISWGKNPFNGGAYSHFAPNQINKFVKNMALPLNRLHFAGEHTSLINNGMEGALESAERVIDEIMAKI